MKKYILSIFFLLLFVVLNAENYNEDDPLGLAHEYSMDYFELGIRALHTNRFELSITEFLKSLSYRDNNVLSRLYLGEAYKKAGYERNALYTWNNLLSMGYESRFLKSRISYLYNRRGMLSDIFIDKNFLIRTELKGFYSGDSYSIFLNPSQIAVDHRNHYFVASFSTGSVVELDTNLEVVRTILTPNPVLGKPFGVAVAKDGDIFVSDFSNDIILKINRYNIVTQKIGFKGIGVGGLLGPQYLETDNENNLYVVDSGNVRINKYSSDGLALFSFGTKGDGKLITPGGIFYDNGEVLIADRGRNEIVVFDISGNYLRSFGSKYLKKPYDITRDDMGRYIFSCEKEIWVYEKESGLWYILDSIGSRLERGVSLVYDHEDNLLVSDYNRSTVYVMSLERRRYNNMYVNIEKVVSSKYPDIHLLISAEKDNMEKPVGITDKNITIYENNKRINGAGMAYTELLNKTTDISIVIDNTQGIMKYKNECKTIVDRWMTNTQPATRVSLITTNNESVITPGPLGSTRLELLDMIDSLEVSSQTDKGELFKTASYDMIDSFSKKSIVFITDSKESGRDFERFKIEDTVQLAINNDIKIYVISFEENQLSKVYKSMAERTGGEYYTAYKRADLIGLFSRIEKEPSKYIAVSYVSSAVSRFGREPVRVEIEVNYSGMKGVAETIYYPPRR